MNFIMRYNIARFAHTKQELFESIKYFTACSGVNAETYPLVLKNIRPALDALLLEIEPLSTSKA